MVRKGEVLLGSIYLGLPSSSDPPPVQVSILELVVTLEHLDFGFAACCNHLETGSQVLG